jgi:large subunit ribosomal protein L4
LTARPTGRSRFPTRSSGWSRGPTSCSAWSAGSSPSARPAPTSAKAYKQKGTGRARHGNKAAPQFRGGGKAFGPVVRSHEHDLPKKVRALALKHALSAKLKDEKLIVIAEATVTEAKTKALAASFRNLGLANALIVDGAAVEDNFRLAARNIPEIDVLPIQGINVYDIMRRDTLVLTKAAVEALTERFK